MGSRCSRSITIAAWAFCSTSCRNRTREIEVSEVSAEAAVAARISATTMMPISIQAVVSTSRLLEELAHRAVFVHPTDGFRQQGRHGQDFYFRVLLIGR